MSSRLLFTAALPYANGSLHLGHLLEYCQADIYVRAQRALGREVVFVCANDAHGTPIELNAQKCNISPEQLIERFHQEHQEDFAKFQIEFDYFGSTHARENQKLIEEVYRSLSQQGDIAEKEIPLQYCEQDQRFLPDRLIRGTCPKCQAPQQYGDVCEACGATYHAEELIAPSCSLCGGPPKRRLAKHLFFTLSQPKHIQRLEQFLSTNALDRATENYVRNWLTGGLKDWCISRDAPYFGFPIPGRPQQYFYVWLDAPLGYVSSSLLWGKAHQADLASLWQSPTTEIEHIIGKDIVYFHALFWPALLAAMGLSWPKRIHVHGMLTVEGEKMSKSRGTFILARDFAQHFSPEIFRYFIASKVMPEPTDVDLSFAELVQKINSEWVNKHTNLFSRTVQFLQQKLDGRCGLLPFTREALFTEAFPAEGSALALAQKVMRFIEEIEQHYCRRELALVCQKLGAIADIGNEWMQSQQPWVCLKSDAEQARTICTFSANICLALAMYLYPIVPKFAERAGNMLGYKAGRFNKNALFALQNTSVGPMERLMERLELSLFDALNPTAIGIPQAANTDRDHDPENESPSIDYAQFSQVQLKVGYVLACEPVEKSKKLLKLQVDCGESRPRQILAGLAQHYRVEELINTSVVIVANLRPTKIMGLLSEGMILAGECEQQLSVLRLDRTLSPGSTIR